MIDLFELPGALPPAEVAALRDEMLRSGGEAARVTGTGAGAAVQRGVRSTTKVEVSPPTRERVRAGMLELLPVLAERFGVELGGCEEPQFLLYREGDFFVPHQDGNTPLIHDDTRFRRVSAVLFVSEPAAAPVPGTYGGGALVLHGGRAAPDLRVPLTPEPGTLVAFRPETTHEVTAVTHGERCTVVTWFR